MPQIRARHLLLAVAAIAVLAAPASAQRVLTTGIFDGTYASSDAALRDAWLDSTHNVGAAAVRIPVAWSAVAPADRPASFQPADPADPAYRWSAIDGAIRAATSRGLTVLISLGSAPRWAEGPSRRADAPAGTWKPSVSELGAFARGLALRYSGSFADPTSPGAMLPRVRQWQVWNEPNLSTYLSPQWVRTAEGRRPFSPGQYRLMNNAFYDAVKSVSADNIVVSAGTAPFGDYDAGSRRLPPLRFWRDVFCIGRRPSCGTPVRFDVLAHHPYSVSGPKRHALNSDDVTIPDLGNLVRLLRSAEHAQRVSPQGRKRVWVTEVSWDSSPPDRYGVPAQRHARWLEEAFYLLWQQGADTVLWYQVRDQAPEPNYATTFQSGLFLRDGRSKPAARAFLFPFVAEPTRGGVRLWAHPPIAGQVIVERRSGSRWITVTKLTSAGGGQIVTRLARLRRGTRVRARVGGVASLTWTVPSAP